MRVFLATGEASGDMLGAAFANAIRDIVPDAVFGGIGGERMEAAGVRLTARTTGWAAMGPLEALRTIPNILWTELRHALWFRRSPWDALVFIDFGAAHVRVARLLRWLGYTRPIVYALPPGVFLDIEHQARTVAHNAAPLTAFAHQRDFYASLGLDIAYFGHPLVSLVPPRAPLTRPPADGGSVAILPGSRRAELERHLPALLGACEALRRRRPHATFVIGAADTESERTIARHLAARPLANVTVVRGARAALDRADAAWISSGTAVLEAALREVPCVALYIIAPAQVPIYHRMWKKRYVTLPNLLLDRDVIPEFLQDAATPEELANGVEALLRDPSMQLADVRALRAHLGGADALARGAAFIVNKARASTHREKARASTHREEARASTHGDESPRP